MLNQIFFEMKHQKVMTWVSISGTALAIFLVMVFFMVDRLPVTEGYPETNRSRMLYGGALDIHYAQGSQSGAMSLKMADRMFGNLDGIEKVAHSSSWHQSYNVGAPGKMAYPLDGTNTDADFWKMYDFRFIDGKPYEQASVESGEKLVVITRSVARKLFGKDNAAGEEIKINTVPFVVTGVIEDVNPVMRATFANIYLPYTPDQLRDTEDFGQAMVHLLMAPGTKQEEIKSQVKSRYDRLNMELAKDSSEAIYHEAPHDVEYLSSKWGIFGNYTPDLSSKHIQTYITYLILLLLPAINLSSMMRGRLRHRVSEIGVRRAFGAKRVSIIMQILGENLIITLIGGLIGCVLSYAFIYFAADYFFNITLLDATELMFASSSPSLSMLFTWSNFFIALALCFILNLMSAFIPAWKASRVEPAVAIAKSINN